MKNELLRSYAALALDFILTDDDVSYSRLNRSALCFRIQEEHTEIEKEISFALENVWNEIKDSTLFSGTYCRYLGSIRKKIEGDTMMNETVTEKNVDLESVDPYEEALGDWIDRSFDAFAEQNGLLCSYTPFAFAAKQNGKVIGVIKGHFFYREIHVGELIVAEDCRGQGIGTLLLTMVEEHFRGKDFDNINLTTYRFQAPEFYKKCGFTLEYIRENPACPALDKFFFVKGID